MRSSRRFLLTAIALLTCSLAVVAADEVYRIGAGDVLRIEVYDEADLSGDYTVDAEGHISYPLLGEVTVGGMPVRDIAARVTELLGADYLFNPQVSVDVKEFRSRKVQLLGGVERPGTYYLRRPTRLLEVLADSGGVAARIGQVRRGHELRITRLTSGVESQSVRVDLYELLVEGLDSANIEVRAGDVIYVADSQSIHVIGEVKKPGTFPFEGGMTVLKAVTLAGGTSNKASLKEAVIRRIRDGKELKLKVGLEEQLEPEDVVEVEKSFW